MLTRCLSAAFCVNETCAVNDRRRTLISNEDPEHHQRQQQEQQQHSSTMSGNQRQVLLAGEYAQRRPVPPMTPLAGFALRMEVQQSHQKGSIIVQQEPELPEKPNLEWPEKVGIDVQVLFDVDPAAVKIGREIGKGSFSIVYAGEYHGQHVAVKCQPKDVDGNIPAFVLREVQVLRLLHHPRLVQFAGAADNVRTKQVWILSEYFNNGDVDLLLKSIRSGKKNHIGWHRITRIALDAARGIEFLQKNHIVHRDIKSSNILLDDQHRAKLCDFGFAVEIKQLDAMTYDTADMNSGKSLRKSYCGTDAYMAPEMFLDEDYDQSVDIFSFGVVLMELLCCRVANSDGFLMRLPQFKFRVLLPQFRDALPASCPLPLAALAEQCVSFEPTERLDITNIVRMLEDVLKNTVVSDNDIVKLVLFTPDKSEPHIEEDDIAYYGENDENYDEDDDDCVNGDEEFDNGKNEEIGYSAYELQANGNYSTIDLESDEEDRAVRSQVLNHPFLVKGSIDSNIHSRPTLSAPHHEGVILKRGRRGRRLWVEKWYILDRAQLHYTDVPPGWRQHQQQIPQWRCKLPPISSLSLHECRIWKTTEMPELRFNVIDSNWKIKRELQAVSKRDLDLWMELISQGIDYANDLFAREHALSSSSMTGTSASSSNASRPSRKKTQKEFKNQSLGSAKLQERRSLSVLEGIASQKIVHRDSLTNSYEPPELPETAENRADEVYRWLKQIGYQRYTQMLKAKGFETLDFIRETGIETEDLNFMGIKEPVARKTISQAARTLRGDD
ncbi:hypothetical protein CCR75_007649 [Bremia lactucae]|uniref:Uncharacterized protein n=1 Tax=Bremia lactucae TaxID=4779 RepID=A0A976NYV5_BRELC|nr:hypothetical protein CCR75_007649 [Bremia lactucae]